ncbi:hypothetical protein [Chelatococcus reniformis]|uniref:Uncharacterized protein n=1 Tax=Chelatococcus reniformis TaxID=1494448 RepID=A0A916UZ42_9HYPH|nr:hypothetical protein [Chelatococcus reniformis]GGC94890.1 hypothetical protein GCM10010994_60760 [Chelatococcus reniformis]
MPVAANQHSGYTPFLLTIRDRDQLLGFTEGRLFLMVLIVPESICQAMADDEWMVRFRHHPAYPLQCVRRSTRLLKDLGIA